MNFQALSAVTALGSLIVAALALWRGGEKVRREDLERRITMYNRLDAIQTGVDEIRIEQRAVRHDVRSIAERVSKLESEVGMLKGAMKE